MKSVDTGVPYHDNLQISGNQEWLVMLYDQFDTIITEQ